MAEKETSGVAVVQGVVALVGITAGAIPLVRVLVFDGGVGRWLSWLPATDSAPGEWAVPLAVVVVALVLIGVLERLSPK